ncbi:MAG: hypothetical protein ACQERC_13155 [Bacteroidota bacterium]
MKKIISYIFVTLLLISCSKQKNQEHTLTGRLMQSCEIPAANKDGIIYFSGGGLLNNPSITLEFTTDDNGYFEVDHNEPFTEFSVRTSPANSVLEVDSIPGDDNDLGEVYLFPPSVSYYLYLEVSNAFTESDTLLYNNHGWPEDGRDELLKIAGPFQSGIVDTVYMATNMNHLPIDFNDTLPKRTINYRIINENTNDHPVKSVDFPTSYCVEEYIDVTFIIE